MAEQERSAGNTGSSHAAEAGASSSLLAHTSSCANSCYSPRIPPVPTPFRVAVTISGSKYRYFILPAPPVVLQDQSLQPGMLALPAASPALPQKTPPAAGNELPKE